MRLKRTDWRTPGAGSTCDLDYVTELLLASIAWWNAGRVVEVGGRPWVLVIR